jgi:hypothetical protein
MRYARTIRARRHIIGYAAVFLLIAASTFMILERSAVREFVSRLTAPDLPEERGPVRAAPTVVITTPLAGRTPRPTNQAIPTPTPITEINLAVPFSAQAPHGNWELPYQEACEEASAMLVDAFWSERTVTPDGANAELLGLVAWQQQRFGYYFHTTAAETATILREFYGYDDVRVFTDIGIADIRREVAAGRPVIIPAAGRLLGNPNFRQPGPVYHMLVVKGFTADGRFITNDVGTRNGHNYLYDAATLLNAIHDVPTGGDDWPAGVDPAEYILTGGRAMIVVYPN